MIPYNILTQKDIDRFVSRIIFPTDLNMCWGWDGWLDKDKYGKFSVELDGKSIYEGSHRMSYKIYNAKDVAQDILICHSCDNPSCVNPAHLFEGTHIDNMKDMVNKNRSAKGSNIGNAVLDEETVIEILDHVKFNTFKNVDEIAIHYSISRQCIYDILNGLIWKHVTDKYPTNIIQLRGFICRTNQQGTNNSNAKLTEEDVKQIKLLLKSGTSQKLIANHFNVNRTTISNINRGKTWKHI